MSLLICRPFRDNPTLLHMRNFSTAQFSWRHAKIRMICTHEGTRGPNWVCRLPDLLSTGGCRNLVWGVGGTIQGAHGNHDQNICRRVQP